MNKVEVNHPSGSEILRESGHRDSNCWCQVLHKHVICTWMWACFEKLQVPTNTRYVEALLPRSWCLSSATHSLLLVALSLLIFLQRAAQGWAHWRGWHAELLNLSSLPLGSFPNHSEALPQIRLSIFFKSYPPFFFPSKNNSIWRMCWH